MEGARTGSASRFGGRGGCPTHVLSSYTHLRFAAKSPHIKMIPVDEAQKRKAAREPKEGLIGQAAVDSGAASGFVATIVNEQVSELEFGCHRVRR